MKSGLLHHRVDYSSSTSNMRCGNCPKSFLFAKLPNQQLLDFFTTHSFKGKGVVIRANSSWISRFLPVSWHRSCVVPAPEDCSIINDSKLVLLILALELQCLEENSSRERRRGRNRVSWCGSKNYCSRWNINTKKRIILSKTFKVVVVSLSLSI